MICTQRTALLASSALRPAHQAHVGRKWAGWGKRAPQAFRLDDDLPVVIGGDMTVEQFEAIYGRETVKMPWAFSA